MNIKKWFLKNQLDFGHWLFEIYNQYVGLT